MGALGGLKTDKIWTAKRWNAKKVPGRSWETRRGFGETKQQGIKNKIYLLRQEEMGEKAELGTHPDSNAFL